LIDIHTHVFPDAVARRCIPMMQADNHMPAYSDGTLEGLRRNMAEAGVDYAVTMPIVTRVGQGASINAFSARHHGHDGILCFGGVHPDQPDVFDELRHIVELGLPGIKLHPDYQGFYIDDPRAVRVIRRATELGLLVLLHTGLDAGKPSPVHAPPERTARALDQLDGERIILAHGGGWHMWEESLRRLAGRKVYMDMAMVPGYAENSILLQLLEKHGVDRLLFGSDSPWEHPKRQAERIHALGLSPAEEQALLDGNARRLLGLPQREAAGAL
jgi:predicted TIM-barrel fold metal-dependent hydrolase